MDSEVEGNIIMNQPGMSSRLSTQDWAHVAFALNAGVVDRAVGSATMRHGMWRVQRGSVEAICEVVDVHQAVYRRWYRWRHGSQII